MTADPEGASATTAGSNLLWIRPEEDVRIYLGRFGDGTDAAAWSARAGKPTGYKIPADHSEVPWRISFRGNGDVEVCKAKPAPPSS